MVGKSSADLDLVRTDQYDAPVRSYKTENYRPARFIGFYRRSYGTDPPSTVAIDFDPPLIIRMRAKPRRRRYKINALVVSPR